MKIKIVKLILGEERKQFSTLLQNLRCGDVLVIKSLDRITRKYQDLLLIWQKLTKEMSVDIVVLDMPLLDTMTIEKKLNIDYSYLTQIWDTVSYETKCDFIFEYIDTIKVKKHQRNGQSYIEILDLTFRPHLVRVFQEMSVKKMMYYM